MMHLGLSMTAERSKRRRRAIPMVVITIVCAAASKADVERRGEISLAVVASDSDTTEDDASFRVSLRYIPELFVDTSMSDSARFAFFGSVDLLADVEGPSLDEREWDGDAELYRLWARYASPRFEARFGLQKIAFGSAALLRPLMWFDQLDPRDPLQLTDGVYGALFRYIANNNANFWLWGLYGNDDRRGWDFLPSDDSSPEYGGRAQFPAGNGEVALSFHRREMDLGGAPFPIGPEDPRTLSQERIGLDGKWDVGPGIWFEWSMERAKSDLLPYEYRRLLTLGLDYTFGVGNGLILLGEHFRLDESEGAFDGGEKLQLSALSTTYRFSIVDQLTLLAFRDWKRDEGYYFLEWRRTYDRWRIHLIGFSNPESGAILPGQDSGALFSGYGAQFVLVFNH
jgi:hypothetical protein